MRRPSCEYRWDEEEEFKQVERGKDYFGEYQILSQYCSSFSLIFIILCIWLAFKNYTHWKEQSPLSIYLLGIDTVILNNYRIFAAMMTFMTLPIHLNLMTNYRSAIDYLTVISSNLSLISSPILIETSEEIQRFNCFSIKKNNSWLFQDLLTHPINRSYNNTLQSVWLSLIHTKSSVDLSMQ